MKRPFQRHEARRLQVPSLANLPSDYRALANELGRAIEDLSSRGLINAAQLRCLGHERAAEIAAKAFK